MKTPFALPAALALCLFPPGVFAQDARPAPALSEIVVTARKREESLARVPASVLVRGAARLEAGNIDRLDELAGFLPGLAVSDTGIGTQIHVRGMGSGNNPAFEQSVGLYLDGIHYGRAALSSLPFLDLARVELLRGPQSVLFGKNAVAGVLNLVSARPTAERFVRLRTLYEFDSRRREHEAVLSGPAGDWRARLAWRALREQGFLRNTLLGRDEPGRREDALRLSLARDFGPRLSALLKLEGGRYGRRGAAVEVVRDEPDRRPPGSAPLAGLDLASIHQALGLPALDSRQDYRRQAGEGGSDTRLRNLTLELSYESGRGRLSLLSGLLGYEYSQRCDCDFTPAALLEARVREDYRQFSQELRLHARASASWEWTAGAHVQFSDLEAGDALRIPAQSPFARLASLNDGTAVLGLLPGTAAARRNRQDSRALSFFLEGGWTFSPGWRLTLGGRQTWETKEAEREINLLDLRRLPHEDPRLALAYRDVLGIHSRQLRALDPSWDHFIRGRRREAQFAPLLRLEREFDGARLYAGVTSGFKGGGFDARANDPRSFEFGEEEAHSAEAGIKSRWLSGALEVNAAVFLTRYRDLQISQFDGSLGFNVGNAEEARARGIEVDGRWAVAEGLRLDYAWSFLDFSYVDFRNGSCPNRRVPDGAVINGVALCDFGGAAGKYAPRQRLSLLLDYRRPLGAASLQITASLNYRGAQQVHDTLDPAFRVGPALRFNLQLALEQGAWRLALTGRNLGGERELSHAGNVPVSAALFGTNSFYAQVARPRRISLEAAWRFGPRPIH